MASTHCNVTMRSQETVLGGEVREQCQWLVLSLSMTVTFRVFKKSSTNGAVTIYLGRRDYVDHVTRWVARLELCSHILASQHPAPTRWTAS